MTDIEEIKSRFPIAPVEEKRKELESQMSNAHNLNIDISKTAADLSYYTKLHNHYSTLHKSLDNLSEAYTLVDSDDPEMKELATAEIEPLQSSIEELVTQIEEIEMDRELEDPDDMKSVILEIRAGAGGDEAALFAADLYRMYAAYADSNGWSVEMIDSNTTETGGYKEVISQIKGSGVYEKLKYESGVHRVQRIPVTESGGRIHTSTASVAILPEAKDVEIDLRPEDLKIDTMRSSGAGGQSVNKTSSAVRITHLPTGMVVSCQDTKVQQQNKEKALQILRARLYEKKRLEEAAKRSDLRSGQIGRGDRAEKIRTYNYPQSRVTDHRVKISWHNLEEILGGSISEMIEDISSAIRKEQLAEITKNRDKSE